MFKIGQRVMCIRSHDAKTSIVNKKGKIIGFNNRDEYCIEFDEDISGHSGNGVIDVDTKLRVTGKYSHCWWVAKEKIIADNKNRRIIRGD